MSPNFSFLPLLLYDELGDAKACAPYCEITV